MNAKSHVTNQSLIEDLFDVSGNEDTLLKNKEYYIDKAQEILCDISIDNYYEFLKHILIKFNQIDETRKKELVEMLNIPIVTKTIYVTKTNKNKKMKKLNMDDY